MQESIRPSGQPTGPSLARLALVLVLLAVGFLVSVLCWHSLGGLDIWLHNQIGQGILEGGFPDGTNQYSYAEPNHPWTNHEWLFQVIIAALGPKAGDPIAPGLARWNVFRVFLGLVCLAGVLLGDGLLERLRARRLVSSGHLWLGPIVLWGLLLLWPRLILRPELFSYIFFVALIHLLDRPFDHLGQNASSKFALPRPLLGAFLLTLLWAQFHGFSALAPVILLLALLARGLEPRLGFDPAPRSGSFWGRGLIGVGLLMLALLVTPNFLEGWLYPLRALGQFGQDEVNLRATISELVPLLETRDSLGLTSLAFKMSLYWGLIWTVVTWGRTSFLRIMLWALAAWATFMAQRNIGFYALSFIMLHTGTSGAPLWQKYATPLRRISSGLMAGLVVLITLVMAGLWTVDIVGDDFYLREGVSRRFGGGLTPGRFPVDSADQLATSPPRKLFTNVDAAAFLLNRTGSRLFIDGRTEAYSAGHWAKYLHIKKGDPAALKLIQEGRPDALFVATGSGSFAPLVRALLQSDQWLLERTEAAGFLFYPIQSYSSRPGGAIQPGPALVLESGLPARESGTSSVRAADLCLSWAGIMNLRQEPQLRERALRRGLEFKPDHPQLQHNLGNILLDKGDFIAALTLFNGALRKNPRLAGSAQNAGVCQMRLGRPSAAVLAFRRAVGIDPQDFEAWANLGTAHLALRQNAKARQALTKAAQLQPSNQRIGTLLRQLENTP